MADIDFSHATMDVYGTDKPMTHGDYLGLAAYNVHICDGTDQNIYSFPAVSTLLNTPSKVSILYSGTMTTNGAKTSFVIRNPNVQTPFIVSNISFNNGDTYSFIIDIETTGS